jgi:hypothetical protein
VQFSQNDVEKSKEYSMFFDGAYLFV